MTSDSNDLPIHELLSLLSEYTGRTENEREIDLLTSAISFKLADDLRYEGISKETLDVAASTIVNDDSINSSDTDAFYSALHDFIRSKNLETSHEFTAVFPLRIVDGLPQTLDHAGISFEKIGSGTWVDFTDVATVANASPAALGDLIEFDKYREGISRRPDVIEPFSTDKNTFFKVKYATRDPIKAVRDLEDALKTELGLINLELLSDRHFGGGPSERTLKGNAVRLNYVAQPPAVLLFDENSHYVGLSPGYDSIQQRRVQLSNPSEFKGRVESFPQFDSTGDIDKEVKAGLLNFQGSLSRQSPAELFIGLWQSLEAVTLTDRGSSSIDTPARAATFLAINETPQLVEGLNRLRSIRNGLVHGGVTDSKLRNNPQDLVSLTDVQLIFSLFRSAVQEILELRDTYSRSELEAIMDWGTKGPDRIRSSINSRESNIGEYQTEIQKSANHIQDLEAVLEWLDNED